MAVIIGVPIAILPAQVEMYDTSPKLLVLFLSLALLLWLPSQWWSGVTALWRTSVGRSFYLLLLAGTASLVVSSVLSDDPWLAFAGTTWRRLGAINQTIMFSIAAVIGGYLYCHRAAAKTLMLGMEIAGAITSIYAILQYAGWDPLIPRALYTVSSVVRPPATLTHATYFATFLLPAILMAIGFRLHETRPRWRRSHEGAMLVSITALVLSGTRSALLGLAAGSCLLLCLERDRIAKRATFRKAGYAALSLIAAATLFLLLPTGKDVRHRMAQWVSDPAGGPRLLVWRDSLQLLSQHAVLGIGPELFEAEFRRAESVELARAYPDHFHESPHNLFLEAATTQGLTGLAVWLALPALACYCGLVCQRQSVAGAAPMFAALVAMLISLQFCPLTMTNELYVLALCAGLVALAAPSVQPEFHKVTSWARVFSVALVLIALAYGVQAALYALTERRVASLDLAGAERSYQAARAFPLPGPNLALSRQLATLSSRLPQALRQQALDDAKQAAEASELGMAERFNGLYQSASLAIVSHNLPQAEAKLRAAIDAAPAWYRPRMALVCVLWWTGRNQEARQEAELALDCAGRLKPNVQRTLDGARAQAAIMATGRVQ